MTDSYALSENCIYVCIISDFNQAELESCLIRKPSRLFLIVSNIEKFKAAARLFVSVINELFPSCKVERSDEICAQLNAGSIKASLHWVDHELKPWMQAQSGASFWLNFTGGPKSLSMALLELDNWFGLDYKTFESSSSQNVLEFGLRNNKKSRTFQTIPLPDAKPFDIARLHNEKVNFYETHTPQFKDHSDAVTHAQLLWDRLSAEDPALLSIFACLNKVWSEGRDNTAYNVKSLQLTWYEFFQLNEHQTDESSAKQCFHELSQQFAVPEFLADDERVIIPGNKQSKANGWYIRRWLSGQWLECLAGAWLHRSGLKKNDNWHINLRNDAREADLLVSYRGNFRLVEIKADFDDPRQMEQQLISIGDRFGRTKKAFLIGPEGSRKLNQTRKDGMSERGNFALRCEKESIALLESESALLEFMKVKIKKPIVL